MIRILKNYRALYLPKKRSPTKEQIKQKIRQELLAAHRAANKLLMFSHRDCNDGIGAVVVTKRVLGSDGIGVCYMHPGDIGFVLGELVPLVPRPLEITDLSLQLRDAEQIVDTLEQLQKLGWKISWRDHHHKQWETPFIDRIEAALVELTVNKTNTESGASLQLQALEKKLGTKSIDDFSRRYAALVRDRDIWINADPDSELLEFAKIGIKSVELEQLLVSAPSDAPTLPDELRAIALTQKQEDAKKVEILTTKSVVYRDPKLVVVYGWLPTNTGLHQMIEGGAKVAVSIRPNGRVSIRSHQDAPISHLICQEFGGGGHPNASGCELELSRLQRSIYIARRGKSGATKDFVIVAKDIISREL